jgi:hypothetical protein
MLGGVIGAAVGCGVFEVALRLAIDLEHPDDYRLLSIGRIITALLSFVAGFAGARCATEFLRLGNVLAALLCVAVGFSLLMGRYFIWGYMSEATLAKAITFLSACLFAGAAGVGTGLAAGRSARRQEQQI